MTRGRVAIDITPSAARLTGSLRDIGYDATGAVADIVDNSISAGASRVEVLLDFDGGASRVIIADDGRGMTEAQLNEALRFGSRREYSRGELGRYGLGLKTASISQCRRLTVVTRHAPANRRLTARTLDLDRVQRTDRWEVTDPPADSYCDRALEWLNDGPGTVVVWEKLDRILPENRPDGGWARRRLGQLRERVSEYLGTAFHRFLEAEDPLTITVNGEKVRPWNPFAPGEEHRLVLPPKVFEISVGGSQGFITLRPYVLPPRDRFSSVSEFERMSGPLKWNRQQGLYIYRADRMIQCGGWSGIRAADEHTKLARASLEFDTELDQVFRINVAKMRVAVPAEVRIQLERSIHELSHRADSVYRRDSSDDPPRSQDEVRPDPQPTRMALPDDSGEYVAFERIMGRLKEQAPSVASALGW